MSMQGLKGAALAAGLVLASAAPAAAQEVRYGGGAPIAEESLPVAISIERDTGTGTTARWTADTSVVCGDDDALLDVGVFGASDVVGEAFKATVVRTYEVGTATFTAAVQLEGTFAGPRASGRVRIVGELKRPGRAAVTCTAGSVAREWEARNLDAPDGEPAVPVGAARLFGVTTQVLRRDVFGAIQLEASEDGSRMGAIWSIRAVCEDGPDLPIVNISPPAAIAADGRFRRDERFTIRFARGIRAVVSAAIGGRVRSATPGAPVDAVGGSVRASVRITDEDGRLLTRCTSGAVPFAARS